jgi:two-component system sensor histidine kinase KdpD
MSEEKIKLKHYSFELLLTICAVLTASGIGYLFRLSGFPETNIVILYLLGVLLTARFTNDFAFGLLASVMSTFAFNYFFTVPYYSFQVNDPSYMVTFVVMTITSVATSTLTSRVKKSAAEARDRAAETQALYHLTNHLSDAKSITDIATIAAEQIEKVLNCPVAILCFDSDGNPEKTFIQCFGDELIHREYDKHEDLAHRLDGFQGSHMDETEFSEWPIYGHELVLGVLRIPMDDSNNLSERAQKLLMAMIESTAMAMDRFRTAEERIHYREESEQERYRGNLLRAISHDLRTPLSGIMGTSEMIMDMSQKADPRYELADGIWKDADWLHSLVENILNLTRLEDGRLALQKQLEAVEEIIGSAIAHVAKRAPEYEINVNIPDELILVPMDAKLIVQVLVNLLDNAIKHTSPKRSISVNVEKNDTFAVFCVSDSGEGIAKDDLPNIFKMFYTSKNNAADAKRGVGLGLPICDAIVKAHGGTISAHNNTDGGAEFKFTLPLEVKKHE